MPKSEIGLDGAKLTLGAGVALPLLGQDGFDQARAGALLTAVYGDSLPICALAYLKRAVEAQREGQPPLALTYLALAGLPRVADPEAAAWRLSAADGLMKAGVAPSTIVEALAPSRWDLERAYNPGQPRVPQGNGRAVDKRGYRSRQFRGGHGGEAYHIESSPC